MSAVHRRTKCCCRRQQCHGRLLPRSTGFLSQCRSLNSDKTSDRCTQSSPKLSNFRLAIFVGSSTSPPPIRSSRSVELAAVPIAPYHHNQALQILVRVHGEAEFNFASASEH